MISHKFGRLLAFALAVGAWACSHDERPAASGNEAAVTPAASDAPSGPAPAATESSEQLDDAQVTTIVRAVNVAEVDQARTASGKLKDESVKKFAQMMMAQHGQAVKNLDELNTKLGLQQKDSQLATELGVKATAVEQQLSATNDSSIDKLYITGQVDAHRQVLDTIDSRLIPAARRDEVKELLRTLRPTVAEHLQHAQRIRDSLKK